jgi:hypothetical protein
VLGLKTPKERAEIAHKLARSFELVRYRNITYQPAHYETGDTAVPPSPTETVWIPLDVEAVRRLAAGQFDVLFPTESELRGFEFMVAQNCTGMDHAPDGLLVRTTDGLRLLNHLGQLEDTDGSFVPNAIIPMLNDDAELKAKVFDHIAEWVNSEEEAHSLLRHVATSLAPGWSAVKYLLLMGEGRNGKSVFLKMVHHLFGTHNVSHVTRQAISLQSPAVLDLNGKLVNLVYDGQAEYLKDSGAEKTLIAGEVFPIRRLYDSTNTPVQTNALFIEGLQQEPKSKDKSSALQKRLVRFWFPNIYPQDNAFERMMLSEPMLGAFLSLLIDHYVLRDAVAKELAPTSGALELQLEHMYHNSIAMQFLKHIEETDALGVDGLIGEQLDTAVDSFRSWRVKEGDVDRWADPDVELQLRPLFHNDRKTKRLATGPRKVRVITGLKPEAEAFLNSLKGDPDDEQADALVED